VLASETAQLGDWQGAVDIVRDFLTHRPGDIPALLRLIELAVDGGLDDVVHRAQVELADAYRDAGMLVEADTVAASFIECQEIATRAAHPQEAESKSVPEDPTGPSAVPAPAATEVDLSVVLEGIPKAPVPDSKLPADLDEVFAVFRDEASRQAALDAAD